MPGSKTTIARVRPAPIVRVPPMSFDPGRKQHTSPVWMRMLWPFRFSLISSNSIRPGPALRRFLSNSTTPDFVTTLSVRVCVAGSSPPHPATSAAPATSTPPRQPRAAIRSHALKLLRTGAGPRATLNHPKDHLEVAPAVSFHARHHSDLELRFARGAAAPLLLETAGRRIGSRTGPRDGPWKATSARRAGASRRMRWPRRVGGRTSASSRRGSNLADVGRGAVRAVPGRGGRLRGMGWRRRSLTGRRPATRAARRLTPCRN
jgi:hypothetical protein